MASNTIILAPTSYALFDTELGVWGVAWTEVGLARLQLPGTDEADTAFRLTRGLQQAKRTQQPGAIDESIKLLQAYASGAPVNLDGLPLDLSGVPEFHCSVYAALREVPRGQTTTYGSLATQIGSPGAAQAIGQAMSRNPVPVVVPCHRVLAAGRKMGGFSAPGGTATKDTLLQLEGVRVALPKIKNDMPMLPGLLPDGV